MTPQTNEEIAVEIVHGLDVWGADAESAKEQIIKALDLKDAEKAPLTVEVKELRLFKEACESFNHVDLIQLTEDKANLEAEVEELKKQILDMKLLPNQGHACDGFCLGTCLHGTRLEANLKIAVEALEKITTISQFGRHGGPIVTSEHYEAAWLDCVEIAKQALSRLKSGGTN